MIRIPKLTDYAIVLLCQFAGEPDRQVRNARDLAACANMPVPTVSKLLKVLLRGGILVSHRGAHGGYSLARPAEEISVADIILAVEGPIALTECSSGVGSVCALEQRCPARTSWMKINAAIRRALEGLSLSDMLAPPRPETQQPVAARLPVVQGLERQKGKAL